MSVSATTKKDIPIDPKVGALFDEIKMFIVSDIMYQWKPLIGHLIITTLSVAPLQMVYMYLHHTPWTRTPLIRTLEVVFLCVCVCMRALGKLSGNMCHFFIDTAIILAEPMSIE